MRATIKLFLLSVFFVLTLNACVTMPDDFEEPSVSVTSLTPKNSAGITPQFEIILRISNPNREPLTLEGMSYTIRLDGNKVMSGVANDLPTIEPYGEAEVTLHATADLLGSFQLITGMMNQAKEHIDYEFKAKLDIGAFMPRIDVIKKGTL